jgi:hypothetical protein
VNKGSYGEVKNKCNGENCFPSLAVHHVKAIEKHLFYGKHSQRAFRQVERRDCRPQLLGRRTLAVDVAFAPGQRNR